MIDNSRKFYSHFFNFRWGVFLHKHFQSFCVWTFTYSYVQYTIIYAEYLPDCITATSDIALWASIVLQYVTDNIGRDDGW